MPNAMDYDALAKIFASEQDPRQITITDALQKPERDRKIQMLLEEARAQQQFENQRNLQGDQLKNDYMRAQIAQMQAAATRENGTQKANLMKEQALEKARRAAGILSGIKSSYDLPGMDSSPALDSFVNDKEIPEEAKRFLRPDPKTSNYTKQAIDAAINHLNGYDPLQMKQLGIQTRESNANLRNENTLDSAELRKQWELESKKELAAEKAKAASAAKSAQEQYNKSVDNWRANPTKQNEDKVRSDYDILRASWLSRISNNPDMSAYMETVGGIPKEPPVFNSKTQETQKAPTLPAGWTKK